MTRFLSSPAARSFPATLAVLLAAGLLAGCNSPGLHKVELADHDYAKRHPIMISEEPETLVLPIGMNASELSPQIARAIGDFLADYSDNGTGVVTIQVPSGSANEVAALAAGRSAHRIVVASGVPASLVRLVPYPVNDHAKLGAVRLAFLKVKATTPTCGLWPEGTEASVDNRSYYNFGCATQQNLAAQVDNPADLLRPRASDPASGARRAQVLNNYEQGKETRSESTLLDTSFDEGF